MEHNMTVFGALETLRQKPIPDLVKEREQRKGCRTWQLNVASPHNKERLIPLSLRGTNHYSHDKNPPYYERIPGSRSEFYVRESVARMLYDINGTLQKSGLELMLFDAWRSQVTQAYCRDVWFKEYLRNTELGWTEEQINTEVGLYWAAGPLSDAAVDPLSPPPHATGGAVDLSIAFVQGDPLWMGTIFDDVSEAAYTDYLESHVPQDRSFTYLEGLQNRRLLYWLMLNAGFEANPNEWWHYSWGDQLWAKITTWRTGMHTDAHYSSIIPMVQPIDSNR
jgi:D-alanyl-D-alanine dipeptidase